MLPCVNLDQGYSQRQFIAAGKLQVCCVVHSEEAIHIGMEVADTVQDENRGDILLASQAHTRAAAKDWDGARASGSCLSRKRCCISHNNKLSSFGELHF